MSKKRKKGKQRRSKPNIPPLTLLRPKLDTLLSDEALADKEAQAIKTDLDTALKGMSARQFLPILLRAYLSAPERAQTRLDKIVPEWLGERGDTPALLALLQQHTLDAERHEQARAWLADTDTAPSLLQELQAQPSFYQAFSYYDDSQGIIILLWYADHQRRKIRGLTYLIDFNPPWEGAVKDIMNLPPRAQKRAGQDYVSIWRQRDMPLESLAAAEVKKEILQCLVANQEQGIRLPRDLIQARLLFFDHVLSLPDRPDTPSFTAKDFDALRRSGKTPESIMQYEQTVGRRVRIEDGKELLIMGAPFDDDFDDDDW